MLLKRKVVIIGIIFLLIIPISYAQVCEVGKIKQVLRKILYLYFTEPESITLTVNEAKDMLIFYLSISAQNLTADCSVLGANSNKPIFDVMTLGDALPEKIPSCADETKYGECSKFRPAYCYAGALYQKCDLCGCPANSVCGKSKRCEPLSQNITCFSDIDCGQNTFIGDYYCTNNYISKNYINYTCINSGTTSSRCVAINSTIYLTYCNSNLNQACVNEQSTCKTTINDSAPTVSISVAPTTVAQGQFFNVTVTGTDDIGLAAIWWWAINTTDAELNKAHWFSCNGAKFCSYSWLVSTNAVGSITLGANSRDTAYPVIGQPHQASEGQGIAYATITITGAVQNLTGSPDLVVSNLGTYTGTTSTNILISATILNNGTGPAQNTCDGLYVETLNARGFCGGPVLMPGQTKSISSAFALPVPGTFKVRADTDYGRWVNESNEFNNVVWSTITVTSPYSAEYLKANTDLTVTDIDVQLPTPSFGQTKVYVTTKNLGSLATGQYWVLTKVTHIDTGKITNVQRLAPVVQPGGTYNTYHGEVGIREYGTYKVEAWVDNINYIPESDENNNFMSVTVIYGNVTQANVTNQTCVDYDNGGDIFTASYAKKGTQAQYDKCGAAGQNYDIIEGVCVNDQLSGVPHYCPTGTKCKDIRYEPAVYANVSACVNQTVTCSDGTLNSQCSATKPLYCYNGALVNNCNVCGCPSDKSCSSTGECQATSCTKPLKVVSTSITNGGYSSTLNSYFKIWAYSNNTEPEKRYGYVDYSGWHYSGYDGGVWSIGKMYQSAKILVLKVRSEAPDFSNPIDFPTGTLTLTIDGSQFSINMPPISSVCAKCNHWFVVFADGTVEKWPLTPGADSLNSWINNMLTSCPSTTTTLSPTGICLVRDSYTSVPVFSAPDFGTGYAKMAKPGINTISGLQSACTQANYSSLLQTYCTQNSNPVQEQVMTYNNDGTSQSLSCGAFGCNYRNCSSISNQTISQPDLIVLDITFTPANPTTADYTTVSFTIKNIGTAPASNFSLKVNYVGGQSFLFGTGYLPAGATTSPGSLGNYWPAGTNTFTATVDINNNVIELDENNNILTKSITIASTTNQTNKSITVLSPNGGEQWMHGQQVTIQWSAANITSARYLTLKIWKGNTVYRQNLAGTPTAVGPLVSGTFSVTWIVPSDLPPDNDYKFEVLYTADIFIRDLSDAPFSIAKSSTILNQTGLKGYAESCTNGIECKYNLTCISDPLDNNVGKCGWWGSQGTFSQCSAGYYPSTPCQCGDMAIYAGACNHGIFYWPPTQVGKSVGSSCTEGSQCSTGICIFGLCSYAVRCHPLTPGYCHDHEECVAFGASC